MFKKFRKMLGLKTYNKEDKIRWLENKYYIEQVTNTYIDIDFCLNNNVNHYFGIILPKITKSELRDYVINKDLKLKEIYES
jgi:hypothetical protein